MLSRSRVRNICNFVGVACVYKLLQKHKNNVRGKETFAPLRRPRTETSDAHVNAHAFEALPDIIKEMYVKTD